MFITELCATLIALLTDKQLGEPKRFHPLVGFGQYANWVRKQLYRKTKLAGVMAWLLCVAPWVVMGWLIACWVADHWLINAVVSGAILYLAIGWQSLLLHANRVSEPLQQGDIAQARQALSMIVSRDTTNSDEQAIASAATESVLENGSDAIFAALFWFWLAGIPGVVFYRLANTLDAMWGYKNDQFLAFGWAAARLDDLLNWLPAQLTAISYALCGNTWQALRCWRTQAAAWKSPNAGPVMASGAGAINTILGGEAIYHNQPQQRPILGMGNPASAQSIGLACGLINRTILLWTLALLTLTWVTL